MTPIFEFLLAVIAFIIFSIVCCSGIVGRRLPRRALAALSVEDEVREIVDCFISTKASRKSESASEIEKPVAAARKGPAVELAVLLMMPGTGGLHYEIGLLKVEGDVTLAPTGPADGRHKKSFSWHELGHRLARPPIA
jgi:hypothetical protein